MRASEIMTTGPEVVTLADPVRKAAKLMRDLNVGCLPIVDDRQSMHLRGVITDRDIAIRHVAEGHQRDCTVNDHMTGNGVATVQPDTELSQVLELMQRAQIRRVPVVEREGRLVGIIAQADIALKESARHPDEVAKTVERISEPAQRH